MTDLTWAGRRAELYGALPIPRPSGAVAAVTADSSAGESSAQPSRGSEAGQYASQEATLKCMQ